MLAKTQASARPKAIVTSAGSEYRSNKFRNEMDNHLLVAAKQQ